ncbi:hypothetical protein [Actinomadura madurae]|uniref:hypothetical protein n=1 Tax=Actinomadura madurae TaxID=1993 RepID=UPI0020D23EA8|nr:hypothetical protein [Actinomadura madurae]MCQ0016231.1 hypothetical protein [Actinomadura madurae]
MASAPTSAISAQRGSSGGGATARPRAGPDAGPGISSYRSPTTSYPAARSSSTVSTARSVAHGTCSPGSSILAGCGRPARTCCARNSFTSSL